MNKRWFAVIVILAMVAGGLYAVFTWNSAPPTPPAALSEIERATAEAREALLTAQRAASEALSVRQSLAKEGKARNEAIHKEVLDFDADRIARELNIFCYGER